MQSLIDQLKVDEGFRPNVYYCSAGHLTIGYGYNIDANCLDLPENLLISFKNGGISESYACSLLQRCVNDCIMQCEKTFNWWSKLSKNRQYAIVNMIFNIGLGGFLEFKNTIHALSNSDWNVASAELLDSKWALQVGARAQRIATVIRKG